jgi:hypothetical protein
LNEFLDNNLIKASPEARFVPGFPLPAFAGTSFAGMTGGKIAVGQQMPLMVQVMHLQ